MLALRMSPPQCGYDSHIGVPATNRGHSRLHLEGVVRPRRHVEKKPPRGEVGALTFVDCLSQPVVKPPGPTGKVAPRRRDVTLAPMIGVVHHNESAQVPSAGPRARDERVVRPVSGPGGMGLEQLPPSIAKRLVPQAREQRVVEGGDRRVGHLGRSPPHVRGDPDALPLALSLVEEAQTGAEERDHGGRSVDVRGPRRGGARLVMVLEEAREVVLEVEPGQQVLPDRARRAVHEAVVEPRRTSTRPCGSRWLPRVPTPSGLHGRGLLEPRMDAPAAGVRLYLRPGHCRIDQSRFVTGCCAIGWSASARGSPRECAR